MKRFFLKFTFPLHIFFGIISVHTSMQAQSIETCKAMADSFYFSGNHQQSLKLYKRVDFFDTAGIYKKHTSKQIGYIYYLSKDYENAAEYFEKSYFFQKDSTDKNDCIIYKTRCLIAQEKYIEALGELSNLTANLPDSQARQKNLYMGICHFFYENPMEAARFWTELIVGDYGRSELIKLLKEAEKVDRLSPQKAKNLSKFIPGAGQLYAHEYGQAINSFLLVGGLGALFYITYQNYALLDAIMSVYPWLQRYYTGGYSKAYDMVVARKVKLKNNIMIKVAQLMQIH